MLKQQRVPPENTFLLKHEPYTPWAQFSHDALCSIVGAAWTSVTSVPGRVRNQKISHERPPAPRSQGGDSTWKHRNTPSPLRAALSLAPPLPPAPRPYWLWPPPLLLLLAAAGSGKLAAAVKPSMAGGVVVVWWRWWWQPCQRGVGEPSTCGAPCARRHREQLPLLARQANSPGGLGP